MTPDRIGALTARVLRAARGETGAVAALFVLAAGLFAFIELADGLGEAGGQAFDRAVLAWLQPAPGALIGPWWLREAAQDLTSLGGISVLTLFALIAFVFLLVYGKRLSAVLLAAGLAGGVALSEGLKAVFERDRPPAAYQAVETLNASFPSGHALLSTVFYLTLGVMLIRAFPRRRLKALVLGAAVLIVLLVGLTRVYLGAHWLTDVLAGWSVGAAWAMALWLAAWAAQRRSQAARSALRDADGPG